MKVRNKEGQEIELELNITCLSPIKVDFERDFIIDYKIPDIPINLRELIFEIAHNCGMFYIDLELTKLSFYVSLLENKFDISLFVEIFPIKIREDEIDDILVTFDDFNFSQSFYDNAQDYENSEFLEIELTGEEKNELQNLLFP